MKFSLFPLTTIVALALFVAPALAGSVWCNGHWKENGLMRVSFTFRDVCEEEWGRCFMRAFRGRTRVIDDNWQCWQLPDGRWQVDINVPRGFGNVANAAIEDVTGLSPRCDWPTSWYDF